MPPKIVAPKSAKEENIRKDATYLKDSTKNQDTVDQSSFVMFEQETIISPRSVRLSLELHGDAPGPGDWNFLAIFNGQVVLEGKWNNETVLKNDQLPFNLKDPRFQPLVADRPLILLLRSIGAKVLKEVDPLTHPDNRAGATVDMSPLLLGEDEIYISVHFILISTGEACHTKVVVHAIATGGLEKTQIPLVLTMLSAHCLPIAKDGTVYLAAIGLSEIVEPLSVNFGMSLSNSNATKVVWATASSAGVIANTAYSVPKEDKFVPEEVEPQDTSSCNSVYWNAMKRLLLDPTTLRERLSRPFLIELAGVPRTGKTDVRGRYMGFIDAGVLLEPGQIAVTICAKLRYYVEAKLPINVGPLLELPPTSAKASARIETDMVSDEYGHDAYVTIRFDLTEPLVPKLKISSLFETIGFPCSEGPHAAEDELHIDPPPEDLHVDAHRIRAEGGALAVHKELSSLACRGAIPMNQSIKRTAANRLLMRVRTMLKQFPSGDCSHIEWQDTVTGQHAASRRAVTASFAPQPPPPRLTSRIAATRSRMAGDTKIADRHVAANLKVSPNHPRVLFSKILRCLESRNDTEANDFILKAMKSQSRNRFLLWVYGAQQFDKGAPGVANAKAAFRIAVKGDYSDGTANAVGWAALHALNHFDVCPNAAFVAAMKMRKSYELKNEWRKFLQRWTDTSGEEEVFWMPGVVASHDPMIIASAFFLCLRCYKFSTQLLQCYIEGCSVRGSFRNLVAKVCPDVYYLRAASLLLRRQIDEAIEVTEVSIKRFGPSRIMSQMRATCLVYGRSWDGTCDSSLREAEVSGAELCPALLLQAALGGIKTNPEGALQRAARAHKIAPCAYSALIIARVYSRMGDAELAERWAAAAVKTEPYLADGWAFLAILAMKERHVDKARTMLRTAKQVGSLSPDIEAQLKKIMDVVKIEDLPDLMTKNLCYCNYF